MKIQWKEFMDRMSVNNSELARMLDVSPTAVGSWLKEEKMPTYKVCCSLIKIGMTCKELFGEEITHIIRDQLNEEKLNDDEFEMEVLKAMKNILNKV